MKSIGSKICFHPAFVALLVLQSKGPRDGDLSGNGQTAFGDSVMDTWTFNKVASNQGNRKQFTPKTQILTKFERYFAGV